jgi:hypothetical protein
MLALKNIPDVDYLAAGRSAGGRAKLQAVL